MKILAVSDEENNILWSGEIKNIAHEADLIISCGDLKNEYLEFLLTMINAPLLYVFGNHDITGPEGGICIDGRIYNFEGVKFLGLGGSMRYRHAKNMYTENEMRRKFLMTLPFIRLRKGFDVLITHAPAKGYGDLEDTAHRGFETFNAIIRKYKPRYMLHGHIHNSYGRIKREYIHENGTKIINVCGYRLINF